MDEDYERIKALSQKIAHTVVQAYARRFPHRNFEDSYVIVNSMMIALVSYLHTLHPEDREVYVDEIISGLLEVDWHE